MSDALSALLHLSAHDYSWLAQFFSLLFLPFAHEDLAIIFGAYVVVILAVLRFRPVPFVASFTGYFIVLYLIEALYLKRLFSERSR